MSINRPHSMLAAVIPQPGTVVVQSAPVPQPSDDEVLIKVHSTGICGTDLHLFRGSARGAVYPLIPGHEFSGEIARTGSQVRDIPVGARVVAEGRAGTGFRRAGAYAEYVTVPQDMVHILPPDIDLQEAALVDPLACAINAVNQAQLSRDHRVVVIGQGSSGLCMLQAARAMVGCAVAAVDFREDRLALSRQFGAALTVTPQDAPSVLAEWAGRDGIDRVLEATGQASAVDLALRITRRNGRIVVYGVFGEPIPFAISEVVYRQLTIVGAVGSPGTWPTAIALLAQHKVQLRPMVTNIMPLRQLPDAFELLEQGNSAIKVIITPE